MGALDESSIFKSLHSVLKSDAVTPEEQAAQNIDGALREWFQHGKDVYEKRRSQMKEVAERAGITWLCKGLDVDYDLRMDEHKEKYMLEVQSGTVATFATTSEFSGFSKYSDAQLQAKIRNLEKWAAKYPGASKPEERLQQARHEVEARSLIGEMKSQPMHDDISALTEADQLTMTDKIFARNGFRCVGKNICAFGEMSYGEIDAVYDAMKENQRIIAVVEAKTGNGRKKARQQLRKYGAVFELLQPQAHIRTYMMLGTELFFVDDYGSSTNATFNDELE